MVVIQAIHLTMLLRFLSEALAWPDRPLGQESSLVQILSEQALLDGLLAKNLAMGLLEMS